jgi:hypothetical protein
MAMEPLKKLPESLEEFRKELFKKESEQWIQYINLKINQWVYVRHLGGFSLEGFPPKYEAGFWLNGEPCLLKECSTLSEAFECFIEMGNSTNVYQEKIL